MAPKQNGEEEVTGVSVEALGPQVVEKEPDEFLHSGKEVDVQLTIKPEPSLERVDCRTGRAFPDLLVDPVMPAGNLGVGKGLLSSGDVCVSLAGRLLEGD